MGAESPMQVIPVSVVQIYADGSYVGATVAVGDVSFKTPSGFVYEAGKEYWWVSDAHQDLPDLFAKAKKVTLRLEAKSDPSTKPPNEVVTAAYDAEQKASWQLVDVSVLSPSDWKKGDPYLPGAVSHYFFEDPKDPTPKKIRLAFATNTKEPSRLTDVAWFASTDKVEGYFGGDKPGAEKSLVAVQPGPKGGYPGPSPFYSHTTKQA